MQTAEDLRAILQRIDRRGYPAYQDIRGTYRFPGYVLSIDHVQKDPFAAPSSRRFRLHIIYQQTLNLQKKSKKKYKISQKKFYLCKNKGYIRRHHQRRDG